MVSIVTVNYNGFSLSCQMIKSIEKYVSQDYQMIVVDNGSSQDEAAMLKAVFPWIITIRSEKNLGFAGGNNLGIEKASGEYIFLLNNDTYVEDDVINTLSKTLDNHPETGVVCPKIKFAHGSRPIQFAGYTALSLITLRNSLIGFNCDDDGSYDEPSYTPYAHGAAMMLRREAIEAAGLMPEIYFLYYEELDWSEKIIKSGYNIEYEPKCIVYHKESATIGALSVTKTYYLTRNRLLFGWRNRRGIVKYLTILYQICFSAPKNMVLHLINGKKGLSVAVFKGVIAFFRIKDKMK